MRWFFFFFFSVSTKFVDKTIHRSYGRHRTIMINLGYPTNYVLIINFRRMSNIL